jgi:hypothetical protein
MKSTRLSILVNLKFPNHIELGNWIPLDINIKLTMLKMAPTNKLNAIPSKMKFFKCLKVLGFILTIRNIVNSNIKKMTVPISSKDVFIRKYFCIKKPPRIDNTPTPVNPKVEGLLRGLWVVNWDKLPLKHKK